MQVFAKIIFFIPREKYPEPLQNKAPQMGQMTTESYPIKRKSEKSTCRMQGPLFLSTSIALFTACLISHEQHLTKHGVLHTGDAE